MQDIDCGPQQTQSVCRSTHVHVVVPCKLAYSCCIQCACWTTPSYDSLTISLDYLLDPSTPFSRLPDLALSASLLLLPLLVRGIG